MNKIVAGLLVVGVAAFGFASAKDLEATFYDVRGDVLETASVGTSAIASDLGDLEDASYETVNVAGFSARFNVLQEGDDIMAASVRLDQADDDISLAEVVNVLAGNSHGVALLSNGTPSEGVVTQVIAFQPDMTASVAPQQATHLTLIVNDQVTTYEVTALGAGSLRSVLVQDTNGNPISLLGATL